MADVFISFESKRRKAAEHLASILELHGYTVWIDDSQVPDEPFAKTIERELSAARAMIVLWCSLSINDDWVRGVAKGLSGILCEGSN